MRKLLVLPFLLLSLVSSGQNFEWVNQYGNSYHSEARAITTDSLKNVYITGDFIGSVDFDPSVNSAILNSTGTGSNFFILKLDSLGNLLWVKRIAAQNDNESMSIALDQANNILITGTIHLSGSPDDLDPGPGTFYVTSLSAPTEDVLILKFNSNGDFIWAKTIGSTGTTHWDYGYGIGTDSLNNVYISAKVNGDAEIVGTSSTYYINSSSFILKLDSAGNYIWVEEITHHPVSIAVDRFGNVYGTGSFASTPLSAGSFTITSFGNSDAFLVKIDSSGNVVHLRKLGGTYEDFGVSIKLDRQNNLIVSGVFELTADFNPYPGAFNLTTNTEKDVFVAKYTSNFNLIWAKQFGNLTDDFVSSLAIDHLNNIYTIGNFTDSVDFDPNAGIYNLYSSNDSDVFIQKLNSNGNFIWAKSVNCDSLIFPHTIAVDKDCNIYSGGGFTNDCYFDPVEQPGYFLTSYSDRDMFIMKYSQDSCANLAIDFDTVTNINCSNNGIAVSYAMGGNLPYQYSWLNTSYTDSTASLTNPGIVSAIVTDSIGCLRVSKLNINAPSSIAGFDLIPNLINTSFRAGFQSTIWLDGFNDGCVPVLGTLSCVLDSLVNFNSSIPPPDLISGDTLFWNFTDLIYDSLHITPVINVTTTGQIGDTVCFSVMIDPISGDSDSTNNYKSYCFPVVNGYDPNDKQVYPQGECIPNYVLSGEPLTYTVRFQNTGNADAINIHILDTLDSNLDLNSLRVIGNSHYLITEILPGNVMKFRFDNIHLPDSGTNELLSHGYVIYEVKPLTGTPDYTLIENTSHIYFDFNPAIITNTTGNTLVDSIPTFSASENISVCYDSEFTMPDGTVYSSIISPVTHQNNLWMVDGCDSIITTNISVLNPIDVTTTLNGLIISANANGLNYQWLDCISGLPVGITTQSFTPTLNGEYSVIVSNGTCSDTSACILINTIGINENQISGLNIYPNPAKNILTIQQNSNSNISIEILNIEGRLIQSFTSSEKNIQTDVSGFANGMYFIHVKSEIGNVVYKLVKE